MNITFLSIFDRFLEEKSSKYDERLKKQENDYYEEKFKFYLLFCIQKFSNYFIQIQH